MKYSQVLSTSQLNLNLYNRLEFFPKELIDIKWRYLKLILLVNFYYFFGINGSFSQKHSSKTEKKYQKTFVPYIGVNGLNSYNVELGLSIFFEKQNEYVKHFSYLDFGVESNLNFKNQYSGFKGYYLRSINDKMINFLYGISSAIYTNYKLIDVRLGPQIGVEFWKQHLIYIGVSYNNSITDNKLKNLVKINNLEFSVKTIVPFALLSNL